MQENAGYEKGDGDEDQRNAESMAKAVDRMLMAGGVLRDPLFAAAIAKHWGMILRVATVGDVALLRWLDASISSDSGEQKTQAGANA